MTEKENQSNTEPSIQNSEWHSRWKIFFRSFVVSTVVLAVLIYVSQGFMNYIGYCVAESRWVSDEEIIRNLVELINSDVSEVFPDENGHHVSHKIVPYEDVDEFLNQNPDCCHFGEPVPDGIPAHFRMKIAGEFKGTIGIHYKLHYLNADGKPLQRNHDAYLSFGNCGHQSKIERFL